MSYETFMQLSPEQFNEAYEAWRILVNAEREHRELTAYRVARWQVWRTLAPPDKKEISVLDLIELPGDEAGKQEQKKTESTRQRFDELAEKWK